MAVQIENKITKKTIAHDVMNRVSCSEAGAIKVVGAFFDFIISELRKGHPVKLNRIGTLFVKEKESRPGQIPKLGVEVTIPSRKVIVMRHGYAKSFDRSKLIKLPDLVNSIQSAAQFHGIELEDTKFIIDIIIANIKSVEKMNARVEIRGLGVFYPTHYIKKNARNPKTGVVVHNVEVTKIRFRYSKKLFREINPEHRRRTADECINN